MKSPFTKNSLLYSIALHLLVLNFLLLNFAYFDKTNYVTKSTVMNATLMEIPKPSAPKVNKEIALPDHLVKEKPLPETPKPKLEPVKPKVEKPLPKPELKKPEPEKTIKLDDKKAKPEKPKPVKNEVKEEKPPVKKEEKVVDKKIEKKPAMTKSQKTQKNMEEKLWAEQLANEEKQISNVKEQQAMGVINKYNALILQAIRSQWVMAEEYPETLSCQLLINLKSDGTVMNVQLTKSSGNDGFDRSARAAVYKASPLPVPKEADLFNQMKEINLTVRP